MNLTQPINRVSIGTLLTLRTTRRQRESKGDTRKKVAHSQDKSPQSMTLMLRELRLFKLDKVESKIIE